MYLAYSSVSGLSALPDLLAFVRNLASAVRIASADLRIAQTRPSTEGLASALAVETGQDAAAPGASSPESACKRSNRFPSPARKLRLPVFTRTVTCAPAVATWAMPRAVE